MEGLRVRTKHEGHKHAVVNTSGFLTGNTAITLLDIKSLNPQPKSLRIDSIHYALQGNMGVCLLWGMEGELEPDLIIPLESRGKFDFSAFGGLKPPIEKWDGTIILRAYNFEMPPVSIEKAIFLALEMEKQ